MRCLRLLLALSLSLPALAFAADEAVKTAVQGKEGAVDEAVAPRPVTPQKLKKVTKKKPKMDLSALTLSSDEGAVKAPKPKETVAAQTYKIIFYGSADRGSSSLEGKRNILATEDGVLGVSSEAASGKAAVSRGTEGMQTQTPMW